jgi:hypothetical protein
MFRSNLGLPLNIKKVYRNTTEFLPKFGDFGFIGSELRTFDSRPPNLRHDVMRTRFESGIFSHLVRMAASSFRSPKPCGRFATLSSGLCMQRSL